MTREEARQLLPFIEAFANGEIVEYRVEGGGPWNIGTNLSFIPGNSYRIANSYRVTGDDDDDDDDDDTVSEANGFRPFKNSEEFREKAGSIVFVKNKKTKVVSLVTSFELDGISINWSFLKWQNLFDYYTFEDDSPCGIEVAA